MDYIEKEKRKEMRRLLGELGVYSLDIKKKIEKYKKEQKEMNSWSLPKDEDLKKRFENIKKSIEILLESLEVLKEEIFTFNEKRWRKEIIQQIKKFEVFENSLKLAIESFRVQYKNSLRKNL